MKHTKNKLGETMNKLGETILAYLVLIVLSFLCLFFFYILLVNSTRSPRRPAERLFMAARQLLFSKT